jgi:hypothetical protein
MRERYALYGDTTLDATDGEAAGRACSETRDHAGLPLERRLDGLVKGHPVNIAY